MYAPYIQVHLHILQTAAENDIRFTVFDKAKFPKPSCRSSACQTRSDSESHAWTRFMKLHAKLATMTTTTAPLGNGRVLILRDRETCRAIESYPDPCKMSGQLLVRSVPCTSWRVACPRISAAGSRVFSGTCHRTVGAVRLVLYRNNTDPYAPQAPTP